MKQEPQRPATARGSFEGFMRRLVAVPHKEIQQKEDEYKRNRPKRGRRVKT